MINDGITTNEDVPFFVLLFEPGDQLVGFPPACFLNHSRLTKLYAAGEWKEFLSRSSAKDEETLSYLSFLEIS